MAGIKSQLDYSLTNLTLLTSVTTFDLKNTMQEISYNEDIFNNVFLNISLYSPTDAVSKTDIICFVIESCNIISP